MKKDEKDMVNVISYPFKHCIEDNFISEAHFKQVLENIEDIPLERDAINKDLRRIANFKDEKPKHDRDDFFSIWISNLHKEINLKLLNYLELLAPEKKDLYQYTEYRLQKAPLKYDSGPHTDSAKKLLSVVVYLHPEEELGTQLYAKQYGTVVGECRWQRNRAFIFSRREQETWHSWSSIGNKGRYVLVCTLMTNRENIAVWREGTISFAKKYLKYIRNLINACFVRASRGHYDN